MPLSTILFLTLDLLTFILPHKYERKKKYFNIVESIKLFFLEINIIDFWFYSILNITIFPRNSGKSFTSTLSFFVALYILGNSLWKYLKSMMVIKKVLSDFSRGLISECKKTQLDIGLEGLYFSSKFKVLYEKRSNPELSCIQLKIKAKIA